MAKTFQFSIIFLGFALLLSPSKSMAAGAAGAAAAAGKQTAGKGGGKCTAQASASPQKEFKFENELKQAIDKNEMASCVPEELSACQGLDAERTKQMWYEFMKAVSYVESSWDSNAVTPCDGGGNTSVGLLMVSGSDQGFKEKCFPGANGQDTSQTKDPQKNLECGTGIMMRLLTSQGGGGVQKASFRRPDGQTCGSLYKDASKNYGPMKEDHEAHYKIKNIVEDINLHCGSKEVSPEIIEKKGSGGGSQPKSKSNEISI